MIIYYGLYTILAITALFDFFINKKKKKVLLWTWVIIFTLFGGLRWDTGNDWSQYYGYFREVSFDNIFTFVRSDDLFLEPGFVLGNVIIKALFGEYYIYNLFVEFIIMSSIKYVGEKCTSYPLLFFAFVAVPGGTLSFAVRSGLAIAISGLGCVLLLRNKWKYYILTILGASQIHLASLVSLVILFVRKLKIDYIPITLAYIFTIVFSYVIRDNLMFLASLSGSNNISDTLLIYSNYDSKGVVVSNAAHILNYSLLLFFVYLHKKTENTSDLWFNTLLWSMLLFDLIQIVFGEELYELKRLMGYFLLPRTILLCYFLSFVKKYFHRYYLPYAVFVVLYLFYQITKTCDGYFFEMSCVPYKTIFD